MHMGNGGSWVPLSPAGVDFSNSTQAMNFLMAVLDDSELQVIANSYARAFWYGVAVVIGLRAAYNLLWTGIHRTRLRAAAAKRAQPARPANLFTNGFSTLTALAREASYLQISPLKTRSWLRPPPLGTVLLLLLYLGFILGLEYTNNDIPGAQHYTALGVRAAWLAIAQIPLLILLAGKNNLIGFVTGTSYDRINVLHRWVARMMLLLATLHFGYQNYGWHKYGILRLEWSTDTCPPTGIATYAILLWINISASGPFRNFSYEFFVVQHLITFFGFIIALMMHLPTTALYSRVYIYIPIALYLLERLIRTSRLLVNNIRPGRATLTLVEDGITQVRVAIKGIRNWRPGAFVLISLPRHGVFQWHPATIASTPDSDGNDLIFLLKSHNGFTKRILSSCNFLSEPSPTDPEADRSRQQASYYAFIDGPYGSSHADFACFDSVALISGGTGISFCLAILLDLSERASIQTLPLRRLRFVWVGKTIRNLSWLADKIHDAMTRLEAAGIEASVECFLTCDETITAMPSGAKRCGCNCKDSDGPCCCIVVEDPGSDDDEKKEATDLEYNSPKQEQKSQTVLVRALSASSKLDRQGSESGTGAKDGPSATVTSGRPPLSSLLWDLVDEADGESGIAVCGPMELAKAVRSAVVAISDERAVHKGTGAQGIYLHAESFGW